MMIQVFVFFFISLWIQFALISQKLEDTKKVNKSKFERRWNEIEKRYK